MKKVFNERHEKVLQVGVSFNDIVNILASLDLVIFSFEQSELDDFHKGELRDLVVLKDKILSLLD